MGRAIQVKIKMNKLPEASAKLREAVKEAQEKFLDDVENLATATVPVDTGKLKGSKERSEGRIAWTAEYAAYVNFGTRHMAPQPFASDAVEKAEPTLIAALQEIEGKLT